MEEGRFHIQFKNLHVLDHDYANLDKTKGCHLYDERENFFEVYTVLFLKPYGYDVCIILGGLADREVDLVCCARPSKGVGTFTNVTLYNSIGCSTLRTR
jgi:hypothetical protein